MSQRIKLKIQPKTRAYKFQTIVRFKSPTRVFANEMHHRFKVTKLDSDIFKSETGSFYELRTIEQKQSYHEEFEAITPLLYQKVYPIIQVELDASNQIVNISNYEEIKKNWFDHKDEVQSKLKKDWLTTNAMKGMDAVMSDPILFKTTFERKPEIKLLFPALQDSIAQNEKQFSRSEPYDDFPADLEIPLNVAYKMTKEKKVCTLKFEGVLDQKKFEDRSDGRQKSEEDKLIELVRGFKNSNNAKFSPLIKHTGFYRIINTAMVQKAVEATSFKIPDFMYQDRITSIIVEN